MMSVNRSRSEVPQQLLGLSYLAYPEALAIIWLLKKIVSSAGADIVEHYADEFAVAPDQPTLSDIMKVIERQFKIQR
jgi:hypothetical protein